MRDKIRALIITAIIAAILLVGASAIPTSINHGTSQKVVQGNGLELKMGINASTIASGHTIAVTISIINTLQKYNLVTAAHNWTSFQVSTGPCGTMNYPMGIAVFKGYYTLSNITAAGQPMELYEPFIYYCPPIFNISAYAFLPYGSSSGQPMFNNTVLTVNSYELSKTIKFGGYWYFPNMPINISGSGIPLLMPQYKTFAPGTYTIVGADEWGSMIILHFQVTSSALSDK